MGSRQDTFCPQITEIILNPKTIQLWSSFRGINNLAATLLTQLLKRLPADQLALMELPNIMGLIKTFPNLFRIFKSKIRLQ